MPIRLTPLVNGEVYHILNRGISQQLTFSDKREYQRAVDTSNFYSFASPPVKFSHFLKFSQERKNRTITQLKGARLVEILCFCLMPNHFHFLVKQIVDDGITKFMSKFQNSFTRYFNTRHQRVGPLFQGPFKAIRVESDEQLLHLSRYVHLNPYSSYVVKNFKDLENYIWSSFPEYLGAKEGFCQKKLILSFFPNKENYRQFVFDQAEYQRELQNIKHLLLEKAL
jgi:putative transposase